LQQIEGRHPVLEALRAGRRIREVFVVEGARGTAADVIQAARERRIPVSAVPRERLDEMSRGRVHQGVIALAEPLSYCEPEDILQAAEARGEAPLVVLLDGVEDPRNLGAIVRTAASAGAHGLVIPQRRSAGLSPAALKTAAGAADYLPVARVVNLARTIDTLRERGLWSVGADVDAERLWTDVDYTLPVALVVGGEHRGLRRLVREKCDFLVRLPMSGPLDSLNASVAAGIILYEAVRQRLLQPGS